MEIAMKPFYRLIVALHALVGIGALAGGLGAVMNPAAPMGMSAAQALKNGPFRDFLIPGLFLICVLGLGNLGAAYASAKRLRLHGIYSLCMGAIMVAWIVIQCLILDAVVALHVIFFCIGAVQGILAVALLYRRNEFPMSVIRYWFGTED
jgi:hypothetical protein